MRRGYTDKPCHGCGTTEVHHRDKLCSSCQKKIEAFDAIQREAAARGAEGARPFSLKERAHSLPYFHHMSSEMCREMQEAFWELSWILSIPTDMKLPNPVNPTDEQRQDRALWPLSDRDYDWQCIRLMDLPTAKAIRRVCQLVIGGLEKAHQNGVAEGKNLLLSLASGNITNDEFNSKAARMTGE
jgi:hypothetical protein